MSYLLYRSLKLILPILPDRSVAAYSANLLFSRGILVPLGLPYRRGQCNSKAEWYAIMLLLRGREAARNRLTAHVAALACLGTEANTPRAIRLMLPARRCWPNVAETVLSCGDRPTAAYSAQLKTGCALKREQIRIET